MADEQPDELVIVLRKPVKLADIVYDKLELREPTAAQWEQWDDLDGVKAEIRAVATVSGLPEAVVKQIGSRDLIKAAKFIASFLG